MKILIMLLLATGSSVVMAGGYYDLSATEKWQDSPTSRSFSDSRYRAQYSPTQRQNAVDQRNADIAKRNSAEMAKQNSHANEMQQYYASERASKQFIDDTRHYNNPSMGGQSQSQPQAQYYPQYSGYPANNYYGNGGVQMRLTPAQTQGFIDQYNIDRGRQAQAAQEQADANYERWRQDQNARRGYERFIGD
ncbi:MAG: hypothetical protein Q8N30_05270 [Methylococcales bacterium]|nr:hypothetical protein [Methylococcales bacterium]